MLRIRAQGRGARDRIEDGGGQVKERKKPQRSCRCHLRNRGDSGRIVKIVDKKGFRLVAADPDDVENSKEAGSVPLLSRLIRGYRNMYH